MTDRTRFSTMAVTAMEMPSRLAMAMDRPVITLRARRGGRSRFERLVEPFGERAVQILDADGYLLLVVENVRELRSILTTAIDTSDKIDISAWNRRGEPFPIMKGVE